MYSLTDYIIFISEYIKVKMISEFLYLLFIFNIIYIAKLIFKALDVFTKAQNVVTMYSPRLDFRFLNMI